jgi:hypothetical protein
MVTFVLVYRVLSGRKLGPNAVGRVPTVSRLVAMVLAFMLLTVSVLTRKDGISTAGLRKRILPLLVLKMPEVFVIVLPVTKESAKTFAVETLPPVLLIIRLKAVKLERRFANRLEPIVRVLITRSLVVKLFA